MADSPCEIGKRIPYDPPMKRPYDRELIRFDDECDTALLNLEQSQDSSLPQGTYKAKK